jgi:hypothetical protein
LTVWLIDIVKVTLDSTYLLPGRGVETLNCCGDWTAFAVIFTLFSGLLFVVGLVVAHPAIDNETTTSRRTANAVLGFNSMAYARRN